MNWTREKITIPYGKLGKTRPKDKILGHETVDAEVSGLFAIHKTLDWGYTWTVTHLPTGRAITDAYSKEAAREFAETVAPLTDWQSLKPGMCPPEIKDQVVAAHQKAQGYTSGATPAPTAPSAAAGGG